MKAYKLIESTADEIIANGCTIERHIITAKLRSIIASYQSELYNIVKPIEIVTNLDQRKRTSRCVDQFGIGKITKPNPSPKGCGAIHN